MGDDGDAVFTFAVALGQLPPEGLRAGHKLVLCLPAAAPPAGVAQRIGQTQMGKFAGEVGAIGTGDDDRLACLRRVLVEAASLVSFGPGVQRQPGGLGHVAGGDDGPQHEAGVKVGQAKAVAVVAPGGGANLVISTESVGAGRQMAGQQPRLGVSQFGQRRVGHASGVVAADPGGGVEGVVGRLGVTDEVEVHGLEPVHR